MRKTWKKGMAAAMVLSLMAGTLGACGNSGDGTTQTTTASGTGGTQAQTTQGSGSTSGEKEKLVIALQTNSFITDYDDNYYTNLLEDELGIELEFYLLPSDTTELRTKVSLMVASKDDMPDIFCVDNSLTAETILDYGSKGAFIPLNDYLEDASKSPNFNAIPDEDKANILRDTTSADGNIYALPKYEPETWNLTPYRMFLNTKWLENLGLEMPETTDDLYEVLKAFVNDDPNGNGIKDEIGIYGYSEGGYGQNTINALMNSFVFYNGGLALDDSGEDVIAPFTTDGWKKGLEYLNKLYAEGLLAATIFTDDDTQFKATLNNESANIVGLVSAGSTSNWPDVDNNSNFQELDIVKPFTGPDGIAYTWFSPYKTSSNFFITSNCQNPDLAFKLGDLMLRDDISKAGRFGEEGVDWTEDEAVCAGSLNAFVDAGIYDRINLVYQTNIWAENSNKFWHNVQPRYASLELGNTIGNGLKPYDPNLKSAALNAYNYEYYYEAHPEFILPALTYTVDEAAMISEPVTNITEYVKQSLAEFVTGARDINSGWDSYLKEMNSMGLEQWIECAQTAYDRTK